MSSNPVHRGKGHARNPLDGDELTVELSVRDDRVLTIGVDEMRTGITMQVGDGAHAIWFRSGAEARTLGGHDFKGCDNARKAALVLHRLFVGRTVDESLEITCEDVRRVARVHLVEDRGCVATILAAVRTALIDVQMTALAEAVLDGRAAGAV